MERRIIYSPFSSSFLPSPGVPPLSSMSVRGTCRGETARCTGRGSPPWRGPGLQVSLTIFYLLWFMITLFKINYVYMHRIFQVLPSFWKSCLHAMNDEMMNDEKAYTTRITVGMEQQFYLFFSLQSCCSYAVSSLPSLSNFCKTVDSKRC